MIPRLSTLMLDAPYDTGTDSPFAFAIINGSGQEELHFGAGTDNFTVYNTHYMYNMVTGIFTKKSNASFSARNETMHFTARGKGYVAGGADAGSPSTFPNDSWYYDGSWHQITSAMTGHNCCYNCFAYDYDNDVFYSASGIGSDGSTLKISSNLIGWTFVATLPTALQGAIGTTMTYLNGKLYICGGSNAAANPYLWEYDIAADTFTMIATGVQFSDIWPNICATPEFFYLNRGTDGFVNQKGCYWATDPATWTRFPYERIKSHANAVNLNVAMDKVIMSLGNGLIGTGNKIDITVAKRIDVLIPA